jgi:low affinity Fe/Cu permease
MKHNATGDGRALKADKLFTVVASTIASWAGQPAAFVLALGTIVMWLGSGPAFGWSDTWQLVVNTATTIITFLMVFLIQNSQNRDSAAMQAKLDELIRATNEARNAFIGIEHMTDMEIERIRHELEAQVASLPRDHSHAATLTRLLERR